jgi:hypothetical protein
MPILSRVMKIGTQAAIFCFFATLFGVAADCSAQTAPARDHWGERFSTQGAKLTSRELVRASVSGRTVVTYNLFASGLPKDQHYILWVLNVGAEPQPVADAYVNQEGKIVNVLADPRRHIAEDPINVKVFGARGEPIQFALTSEDDRLRVFVQIVPFPMEVTSGPCHLSGVQTAPYYSVVSINVTGLQPNEELILDQHSENEGAQTKANANDQGNYNVAILPFVKGKRSGKARFNLASKSCKIGIEFPWGDGSYKYQ